MNNHNGFEVIDRRGQKKDPPAPTPVIEIDKPEPRTGDSWKDVAFLLIPIQMVPFGPLVLGKAVGLRQDELEFIADYVLNPFCTEDSEDWRVTAKKRLDTFLNCNCKRGHTCGTHHHYFEQWQKGDIQRLELMGQAKMPECLEVFFKAAQARANSKIVRPH
jgi:hypothetical protein